MSDPFAGSEPPGGVNYGEFSFRVRPHVLASLAATAAAAVPSSAAVPSLTCFRVRVTDSVLSLAATDMERTVIAATSAVYVQGVAAEGCVDAFIPAKKLMAILKEVPEEDVTVSVKKDKATVTAGSGSWLLKLPDSGDYPELVTDAGDLDFAEVHRERFLAALRAVRHVVCKDAGRPPLTQVAVTQAADSPPAQAWAVTASDGTRFARSYLDLFPQELCIPSSVLDSLMKLLAAGRSDYIGVAATESSIAFSVGPVLLAVARRSTQFPDVDSQILRPAYDNDQVLTADRDELAAAVRRVRVNADADTAAIALLASESTLTVESLDKGQNSATETIPADWGPAKERVLCLNHVFLSELLAAHPAREVRFRLGRDRGERRSVLLVEGSSLVQVMAQMSPKLLGY